MSLANLRAAARLAREASQGRRTIELVVTEEGLLVRGWTVVDPEFKRRASRGVPWPADLASNAVELVDRRLSAMEGAA